MAIDLSILKDAMPIWAFALVFILTYAVLAKTKILGKNKGINSIISIILAIIFTTFTGARNYLTNLTPWFAVLLAGLFFFGLIIAFIVKEPKKMFRGITIAFIVLLTIVIVGVIFYTFPATQALLPAAIQDSDYNDYYDNKYCDSDYEKTKVYDYDYYYYKDCDKKDGYYRCDDNHDSGRYDRCIKYGSEYKCYDSDDYHYEYDYNKDCYNDKDYRDRDYRNNDNNDIFEEVGDFIYRDKITNAFWLLLVGIIVAIIITRK